MRTRNEVEKETESLGSSIDLEHQALEVLLDIRDHLEELKRLIMDIDNKENMK